MRLLLDTHVFLWCVQDEQRLSEKSKSLILNATEVYVSSASIWEAVIKIKLGKLKADVDELAAAIVDSGFLELPVTVNHATAVSQLPDHHRDSFDRILIAQAITEPLRLLTADKTLIAYSDLVELIN